MGKNIEIPQGKRTALYRFFEILPICLSLGAIFLMVIFSVFSPALASVYLLLIVVALFVKSIGITFRTLHGFREMNRAMQVDWQERLDHLENPKKYFAQIRDSGQGEFEYEVHFDNLRKFSAEGLDIKPSDVLNVVIVAAYNESFDVIEPTINSLKQTDYPNQNMIVVLAYEERGGKEIENTAHRLKNIYGETFRDFLIIKHPKNIPNEVIGKGGNITYAGNKFKEYCIKNNIEFKNVLVTTLDSDNKPHRQYFSCATYKFLTQNDRKHFSYQPISLFLNNIWDVPAPMRVLATGNSFWNLVVSMRPHLLRNFASHSQPMDALVEMNFWSVRTIVEDGHQFWRSYFHFNGDYAVVPIMIPIYQDAVLSDTLLKTLKAQFIQLRRWFYGASDIPYVASHIFSKKRKAPLFDSLAKFFRLVEGHISLVYQAPLAAFGGWIPLLVNPESSRSLEAHQLPNAISSIQQIAMIGLFLTIFISFKMLPPKPKRYGKIRTFNMALQWLLMPITSICYGSAAAIYSQLRLALGKYLDKFDVTQKAIVSSSKKVKGKGRK